MFLRVNFFSLLSVSVLALQVSLGLALPQSRPTDSQQHPSGSSTDLAAPPNQDLNRMFASAVALYNAGELDGAVREYKAILAQVPESESPCIPALRRPARLHYKEPQRSQTFGLDPDWAEQRGRLMSRTDAAENR